MVDAGGFEPPAAWLQNQALFQAELSAPNPPGGLGVIEVNRCCEASVVTRYESRKED